MPTLDTIVVEVIERGPQGPQVPDGDKTDITVSSNGTTWQINSGAVGTSELATNAVTTAKITDSNITTAKIADGNVTKAKLENSAALSVIGRSANSSGVPADIAAANDGEVLRRSGTSIGFGTVSADGLASDSVTTAKIADGNVTTAKMGGDVTAAGKALLTGANAAAQRTSLGLGTAALSATTDFAAATVPVTATGSSTVRVIADREADYINLLDHGGDNTDTTSSNAAFTAALSRANTLNGRAIIELPGGVYRLDSQLVLTLASGKPLTIRGGGRGSTRIVIRHTGSWMRIGVPYDDGSAFLSENITLEGIEFIGNESSLTDQAVFVTNADDVTFDRVTFRQVPGRCFTIGKARPSGQRDDVARIHFKGLRLVVQPGVTNEMFQMVSGAIFTMDEECKVNGALSSDAGITPFMVQPSSSSRNFDGINLVGVTCEGVSQFMGVYGQGISNLKVLGGIADRVDSSHVDVSLSSGGICKHWNFTGFGFQGRTASQGGTNSIRSFKLNYGSSTETLPIYGIVVQGCHFWDIGNRVFQSAGKASFSFINNHIDRCGFAGTPLVSIDTGDWCVISGNVARGNGRTGAAYGIEAAGTSASTRRLAANNIWDVATADMIGTL